MEVQNDLIPRTERFAKEIIKFCRSVAKDPVSKPLAIQLVRSGTSIGANYAEAVNAISKKDFRNKIYICRKETNEACYWLKLLDGKELLQECEELRRIFNAMTFTMDQKPEL